MSQPIGRPRKLAPGPEEVEELGKDLLQWATEFTKEKRTAWSFWYSLKQGMIQEQWKALKKLDEFRPYYEMARAALSKKIHSDELEKGMAHRYARMYDRELAEEEDETKKYDADLKKMTEEEQQKLLVNIINYAYKKNDS